MFVFYTINEDYEYMPIYIIYPDEILQRLTLA